jgi:hypothetical protein
LLLVASLVSRSSPGLEFIRSLPLAELVFDGLPKADISAGEDPLRKLCNMNPTELGVSIQAITEGLTQVMHETLAELKKSFDLLDSRAAADNTAAKKFEITKMSFGSIQDFHDGITARIGDSQYCPFVHVCADVRVDPRGRAIPRL